MKTIRIFSIAVLGLLLFMGPAWGAGDYVSLHHYEQTKGFCSDSTNLGGGYTTGYPCTAPYPYRYTRSMQGYKDIYDLTDPKILCGKDYPTADDCDKTEAYLSFSFVNQRISGANPGIPAISSFPDGFRIFLPPGTISAGVTVYMPQDAQEGVIARYKGAPEGTYLSYANDPSHYGDVPWESGDSITLNTLRSRDVYVQNTGGHAFVLPAHAYLPMGPGDSGWLYIRKMPFTVGIIDQISVNIKVNVAAYTQWYNSVQPAGTSGCVDSNNATQGATYCWDTGGDPWAEDAYVQPVSTCSSSNLDGCIAAGDCAGAGGYWYGGTCNTDPACTDAADCLTQDPCSGSGFYWYDGQCNADPQCNSSDVSQCTSEEACDDSGFYWYGNACHTTPQCSASHLEVCTEVECAGVGGAWSGSQCVPNCSPSNLSACNTSITCANNGGSWNGSTCGPITGGTYTPPPASPPTGTGGICDTPFGAFFPGCAGGGQSTSGNTCDPTNLNLCITKAECQDAGGYLAEDGKCKAPELAPTSQEQPMNLMNPNSLMESAPIGLVDGDGMITPGDKMHLQFWVPRYEDPVDLYAAIQIPGAGNQLLYLSADDDNAPLTPQFRAFATGFSGPLNKLVFDDRPACPTFDAYNGAWFVYFLVIPEQGQTFQTAKELWDYITVNHVNYRLEYYQLNLLCQ
jgi:hypothetical protein